MAKKVSLVGLDKILPATPAKKGSKRRNVTDKARHDRITEELSKCNSASEIGTLAMKFGLSEQEVRERARNAKNFGLFRMVIGNRMRGVAAKISKAKKKNIKLTLHDAAYPPGGKTKTKTAKKKKKKTAKKKR